MEECAARHRSGLVYAWMRVTCRGTRAWVDVCYRLRSASARDPVRSPEAGGIRARRHAIRTDPGSGGAAVPATDTHGPRRAWGWPLPAFAIRSPRQCVLAVR